MMATPQPISSTRYCLLSGAPETLRALPRPASRAISVKVTTGWSGAPRAPMPPASSPPATRRNALRDARSIMRAFPHPVPAFLLQVVGFPLQLRERLHRLAALVRLAELTAQG